MHGLPDRRFLSVSGPLEGVITWEYLGHGPIYTCETVPSWRSDMVNPSSQNS